LQLKVVHAVSNDPRSPALRGVPREVRDVTGSLKILAMSFDNLSCLPEDLAMLLAMLHPAVASADGSSTAIS
jgi:hypothetical protein